MHVAEPATSVADPERWSRLEVAPLIEQLLALRTEMGEMEAGIAAELRLVHPDNRASARNLLHYLALRRHDLRPLQNRLVHLGLSSLGRAEACTLANVNAVLQNLGRLFGCEIPAPDARHPEIGFSQGRALLENRVGRLFGPAADDHRGADIMVTLPEQAATDPDLARKLIAAGTDVVRINCAHDDAAAWLAMIDHVRAAERALRRDIKIAMDLAGPKIRTGPLASGPRVLKWRPKRDSYGRVIAPAQLLLYPAADPCPSPGGLDACVPVHGDWLDRLEIGDAIRFRDARGRHRSLSITGRAGRRVWAEAMATAYVEPGTALKRFAHGVSKVKQRGAIGDLPAVETSIVLYRGNRVLLTDPSRPGRPATYDDRGRLVSEATIGCTLPAIFADLRPDQRILFDDGKIEGVIREVVADGVVIEIVRARASGEDLRADKGINFPDSSLTLPALTEKDRQDLQFVAQHADIVNFSFVRRVEDIEALHAELDAVDRPDLAVVLKIETRKSFESLPRLLLAAMRRPLSGVMIARGDLAVECGWQRLAEVQEEILWLCEAAHVPVIWATQVLERLAKQGMPSRAEITDAAESVRAECVMLNKGPYIVEAVRSLDDILRRMRDHRSKRRSLMRRLQLAEDLLPVEA